MLDKNNRSLKKMSLICVLFCFKIKQHKAYIKMLFMPMNNKWHFIFKSLKYYLRKYRHIGRGSKLKIKVWFQKKMSLNGILTCDTIINALNIVISTYYSYHAGQKDKTDFQFLYISIFIISWMLKNLKTGRIIVRNC